MQIGCNIASLILASIFKRASQCLSISSATQVNHQRTSRNEQYNEAVELPCAPEGRGNMDKDRSACCIPDPVAACDDHVQTVIAWRNIRVVELVLSSCIRPVCIESLEFICVEIAKRSSKAQCGNRSREAVARKWQVDGHPIGKIDPRSFTCCPKRSNEQLRCCLFA